MSEQIDIAVDLGVIPPPLPEILTLRQLVELAPAAPPQIIEGVLHVGSKMILGGTSKSNKSWCLLDLALSVASGSDWWGRHCVKMPVLYINFELHAWAIAQRLNSLAAARVLANGHQANGHRENGNLGDMLHIWNLRGHNADLTVLRPKLEEQLDRHQFGMIIIDPAYKVLGNRDENANGDIASLMNEFEALAQRTGAALVVAHHFAKGDSTVKSVIDRMSGAGAWARDPDSIVVLTPHEEEGCFTVSTVLRNLPQMDDFVVRWDYPRMLLAKDLNPDALRRPQAKNKVCTDREFVEAVLGNESRNYQGVVRRAREDLAMSEATTNRYLARLKEAGLICHSGGLYWANRQEVTPE
jgi:hypothetical protein